MAFELPLVFSTAFLVSSVFVGGLDDDIEEFISATTSISFVILSIWVVLLFCFGL